VPADTSGRRFKNSMSPRWRRTQRSRFFRGRIEVCSGCPGASSGSTSIGVRQFLMKSRDTLYRKSGCTAYREPEELRQRTIDRVRRFLKAHVPMRAAAQ